MEPRNESQAFFTSSVVMQGLTLLTFVFISFQFGITNNKVLSLSILVLCSLVDTLVQRYDVHGC